MNILLRQDGVKLGNRAESSLTLEDAGFLKCQHIEVFNYGVMCLPLGDNDNHLLIEKVDNDCWRESTTGIVYEYLEIFGQKSADSWPKHLEIVPPTGN